MSIFCGIVLIIIQSAPPYNYNVNGNLTYNRIHMVMQRKNNLYKQLNQEQRIEIYSFLCEGLSYREIGRRLHVSHTTISREISRNKIDKGRGIYQYKPIQAEKYRIKRGQKANIRHIKLIKNYSLCTKIFTLLSNDSIDRGPDEILGRLKLEGRDVVSTSTLYNYIRHYSNRSKYLKHKKYGYKKETNEHMKGLNEF